MTTKELIHELVDKLHVEDDERDAVTAREVLDFLQIRQRPSRESLPRFVGMLNSGPNTRGRDAKRIVRESMGRLEE
jgi:hypothetical protein